jgi:hypothetical protein
MSLNLNSMLSAVVDVGFFGRSQTWPKQEKDVDAIIGTALEFQNIETATNKSHRSNPNSQ